MMDTKEKLLGFLLLVLLILSVATSGSLAQGPLSPQLVAMLDYYFANLGTGAVSTVMIQDGAVTLLKIDLAEFEAYFATNTPLYEFTETDPVASAAGYATGTPLYVYTETDPIYGARPAGWSGVVISEFNNASATNKVTYTDGRVTGVVKTP